MRPDRIVVGEARGGEALDMLQAMNTGHEGSLTTVHANSPRDALFRLEMLVLMAGYELPIRAVRENIAAAVDVVVHLERLRDGTRVVTSIQELHGMEGDTIVLQELFTYTGEVTEAGRQVGELEATGLRPRFIERLHAAGVAVDPRVFRAPRSSTRSSSRSSSREGARR
jgi:pilus assembly protein CpaF